MLLSHPARYLPALVLVALWLVGSLPAGAQAPGAGGSGADARPPDLLLLTLDTTRADFVGSYGAEGALTPHLDGLASRGLRFQRALASSPLTLPSHASLMTGLAPPEHGLRDNGGAALGDGPPTLAQELRKRGYRTAAFVASRVLDRRFGLDRGFEHYDDRMAAERLGEYGYPERDAAAVTDAALAWLGSAPSDRPLFLWVHYYDPHAPYRPAGEAPDPDPRKAYGAEIRYMDLHLGRLLANLEKRSGKDLLVAAVGDHGEALGEHGERAHGIFLYRASLEVPLILSGPGVPPGSTADETVAIRRLAATLLQLLSRGTSATVPGSFGEPLPGLPGLDAPPPRAVYSETFLPSTAYGWSPLQAVSDQRWRFIVAPEAELYDFLEDPGETQNRIQDRRRQARRLQRILREMESSFQQRSAGAAEIDGELAASLRSLGYASGARQPSPGGLDPKEGIHLLAELEEIKASTRQGRFAEAVPRLEKLNARSPDNVPFLGQLAFAQLRSGDAEGALATYRKAVRLNPRLDFLHLNLAKAYRRLGKIEDARKEFRLTLEINPRFAEAWLNLAQMAQAEGQGGEERHLLESAVAAGTASALIRGRLGQIRMAAGELAAAAEDLEVATGLLPSWSTAWLVRGQLALRQKDLDAARRYLERAAALAPGSPDSREARRLLAGMGKPDPKDTAEK